MKSKSLLSLLTRNNKARANGNNKESPKINPEDGIRIIKINSKTKDKSPLRSNSKVTTKAKENGEMISNKTKRLSNKIKRPNSNLNNKNGDKSKRKVPLPMLKAKDGKGSSNNPKLSRRKRPIIKLKIAHPKATNITKILGKRKSNKAANKKPSPRKEESNSNNKSKEAGKETISNTEATMADTTPTDMPKTKNYDNSPLINK